MSRHRLAWLLLLSLGLACEPGTCSSPPPPVEHQPCKDAGDWGLCADDGQSALVCIDAVWTRVGCKARPCGRPPGQPTFSGRYWLFCGSDLATEGEACKRVGEVTYSRSDPTLELVCRGKGWMRLRGGGDAGTKP